jgi:hypothetical protein
MEPERFDRLARRLTRARSRRGMLGVVGSGALATSLGLARPALVKAKCKKATNCGKNRFPICQNTVGCIRVKNVDTGRCVCIAANFPCIDGCETGSQCADGLCVFAKGCCSLPTFCATPCS